MQRLIPMLKIYSLLGKGLSSGPKLVLHNNVFSQCNSGAAVAVEPKLLAPNYGLGDLALKLLLLPCRVGFPELA
ncbi:unnamed protein product [Arctia plantaginis]|uniref:Uncharacterized protein n=1 Tax=Arctia plantaginis TaxID=874455 RepID=A0A8S1A9X9_ARCPL|nr:unnamed protein product [Arctia plantaginis]